MPPGDELRVESRRGEEGPELRRRSRDQEAGWDKSITQEADQWRKSESRKRAGAEPEPKRRGAGGAMSGR